MTRGIELHGVVASLILWFGGATWKNNFLDDFIFGAIVEPFLSTSPNSHKKTTLHETRVRVTNARYFREE